MAAGNVTQGKWTDAFHAYQAELLTKIKKGETQDEIPTGAGSYTQTQWDKIMKNVDRQIDEIQKQQKERLERRKEKAEAQRIYEAASLGKGPADILKADITKGEAKVPYGYLAKDGVIEYHGVVFWCDEEHNSLCLGDTSNEADTLVIPLSAGGCLKVNRDSLDGLQKALGMFSPEDVNRILRAIAEDNKVRQARFALEDDKRDVSKLGLEESGEDGESGTFSKEK